MRKLTIRTAPTSDRPTCHLSMNYGHGAVAWHWFQTEEATHHMWTFYAEQNPDLEVVLL